MSDDHFDLLNSGDNHSSVPAGPKSEGFDFLVEPLAAEQPVSSNGVCSGNAARPVESSMGGRATASSGVSIMLAVGVTAMAFMVLAVALVAIPRIGDGGQAQDLVVPAAEENGTVGGGSNGSAAERTTAQLEEPFEIEAIDVGVGEGAPEWCSAILSDAVRSLPSAVNAVGDPLYSDEVSEVFEGAAATLRTQVDSADPEVRLSASRLADVLDVAVESKQVDGRIADLHLERLATALDEFGSEVLVCGYG